MLIHIPQDKSDPQNLGQEHIRVTDIELMRNGPCHGRESFIECPRNFQVLQEIPSVLQDCYITIRMSKMCPSLPRNADYPCYRTLIITISTRVPKKCPTASIVRSVLLRACAIVIFTYSGRENINNIIQYNYLQYKK